MMHAETKDAIARTIAAHIIKTHAEDIERMSINEMTWDELEGLEDEQIEELVKRVGNYIKVAEVGINFPYYRINRETGEPLTDEELQARREEFLF